MTFIIFLLLSSIGVALLLVVVRRLSLFLQFPQPGGGCLEEPVIAPFLYTDADTSFHFSQTPHYLFLEVASVLPLDY